MLPTLYDIAAEYKADLEKLADLDLPPETVADTLEGMQGALVDKAKNIGSFIRHLETTVDAMKEAEVAMAKRRKTLEDRIKRIQDYTLNVMVNNDINKIETPYFNLTVAKNPPKVDIYDPNQVPAHFMHQLPPPPPELDKKAIMESLKAGEDVPGCRITQGVRLSIK